ncbi:Mitochondrial glycoprotein superfamily [Arabidopsis thaliana x Arabidopsis arenosa]|uniref:Mitochondrial glycoprotein superfamily n=1 Tax=Arabidopsis thaliana x Arabidopsis arenosa TaxID=1240361 RepID=A0A8T1YT62_9BRAS|nr:Mitochondrial glycoprotein superfamily [Arabidopsis thaliana x Arabidopsis arenosa]
MATLVRRAASRFVGNYCKNRSFVYSLFDQSAYGRRRHLTPSVDRNVPFTTSTKKRASPTDPLLRIIETEIGYAEKADDYDRVEETPSGFPFKMEDKPGGKIVTLTREYEGETVKVEVHMTNLVTGDKEDDEDDEEEAENEEDEDEDKPEKPKQSNVPLLVTLSKKAGPSLEFRCTAFPDKIVIKDMWVTFPDDPSKDELAYEGPSFRVLDEKLRKAFHRYIEIRGIKPSMINFLHEYMINKDSREHLLWLKSLKNFVKS